MLGSKLRSWMEAVRPKKKHQKKLKQSSVQSQFLVPNVAGGAKPSSSSDEVQQITMVSPSYHHRPEDNGANLSSPESAYSTGYSTDGTSPMGVPDYYKGKPGSTFFTATLPNNENFPPEHPEETQPYSCLKKPQQVHFTKEPTPILKARENGDVKTAKDFKAPPAQPPHLRTIDKIIGSEITSPRQRNRIRTNPWVPVSPCHSSKQFYPQTDSQDFSVSVRSPYSLRQNYKYPAFCSPRRFPKHYESSSCSSLSSTSTHWDANLVLRGSRENSDEEDFTLNEMMGKYDESYVYEKETDILSDSDPTDGEIDTDTGEDYQTVELSKEMEFIDNDSYHELHTDYKSKHNTGNCFYFTMEANLRTVKRSQKFDSVKMTEKRKRSIHQKSSYKNRQYSRINPKIANADLYTKCTRSAENTPISIRKTKHPMSKLALNDSMRRRSNSVSFSKDTTFTFDQRDREATKKYKQLIVEAEHILNNIKITTSSPKRLAPANKRVEMLRTTESSPIKVEELKKSHINNIKASPKAEPYPLNKRSLNHNPIPPYINSPFSPILARKYSDKIHPLKNVTFKHESTTPSKSPLMQNKYNNNHKGSPSRKSPKYKRKNSKLSVKKYSNESISSDTDTEVYSKPKSRNSSQLSCFSEPMKRKVYANGNIAERNKGMLRYGEVCSSSTSNLRQQAMFNTIANLKKNLEDQSASLKQTYKGN